MKNYIKFEVLSFFTKRNIISVFLCLILMMLGFLYNGYGYNYAYDEAIETLKISAQYEQGHIELLSYTLKHSEQYNYVELNFWQEELALTQNLCFSYQNKDDSEILKVRLMRNKWLIKGVKDGFVNENLDSKILNGTIEDLKKQIKIDTKNLKYGLLDGVIEDKPTQFYFLKETQSGSYITWALLFLIVLLNGNIWSKEFSGYGGYQNIFSYPLKKYKILCIRNIINVVISLVCSVVILEVLYTFAYYFYGGGFEQFVSCQNKLVSAHNITLKSLPIFIISLYSYIHLIEFISFLTKNEMNTCFVFVLIALLSLFWPNDFNIYSFLISYESEKVILKYGLMMLVNIILLGIEYYLIEKKDLSR